MSPANASGVFLAALISSTLLQIGASSPFFGWTIAWVAFVPTIAALKGSPGGWASHGAFLAGFLPWTLFQTSWLAFSGEGAWWLKWLLLALLGSFPFLLASLLVSRLQPHRYTPTWLWFPAVWVSVESVASIACVHVLGFRCPLTGDSQLDAPAIPQLADVAGVEGITFLVALGNACVFDLVSARSNHRLRVLPSLLAAFLIPVATIASLHWASANAVKRVGEPIRVGLAIGELVDIQQIPASVRRSAPHMDLLVWPEFALRSPLDFSMGTKATVDPVAETQSPAARDRLVSMPEIAAAAKTLGCGCVIGLPIILRGDEQESLQNGVVVADPRGDTVVAACKQYLVHWQESRIVDFFSTNRAGARHAKWVFTPGRSSGPACVKVGCRLVWLAIPVCSEIAVPSQVRRSVYGQAQAGGGIVVCPSNETSLSRPDGPAITYAQARWRAIENRRPVVRCVAAGMSALIDEHGNSLPFDETLSVRNGSKLLVGVVSACEGLTFYTRFGDWIVMPCFAVLLVIWIRKSFGSDSFGQGANLDRFHRCPSFVQVPLLFESVRRIRTN